MKKILTTVTILMALLISNKTYSQYVSIPDTNFGKWLNTNGYSSCLTGNSTSGWNLNTACSAVTSATSLSLTSTPISNLSGVQYFTSLTSLTIFSKVLKTIPALPASLKSLSCSSSDSLTTLPSLPAGLTGLYCYSNKLTSIPTLPSTLTTFNCSGNKLVTLPSLPNTITSFNCTDNLLTSLPTLPNGITTLWCYNNQLTTLPTLPSGITLIGCYSNKLSTLPTIPSGVTEIYCSDNLLTSLPTLPASLTTLFCSNNLMTSLPALPSTLQILNCTNNKLSSLPTLPTSVYKLYCADNKLTILPTLSGNSFSELHCDGNLLTSIPALPTNLYNFSCSKNQLTTLPAFASPTYFTNIDCSWNQITVLPTLIGLQSALGGDVVFNCSHNNLTAMPSLPTLAGGTYLDLNFSYNQVTILPTPLTTVKWLDCSHNLISTLPALLTNLYKLDCSYNSISTLPTLSNIRILSCSNNQLTTLPTLPNGLAYLDCSNNQISTIPALPNTWDFHLYAQNNNLTTIINLPDSMLACNISNNANLSCLPQLERIDSFTFTSTNITCLPSYPRGSASNPLSSALPLCINVPNGCLGDSIWPGDANHNGIADNNDLLPIGVAYNLSGPLRTSSSIVWTGQSCANWGLQLLNGTNVKHTDCNGDGTINATDTLAIMQNFGLTHNKTDDQPSPWRAGTPALNIVFSKDTVHAGDTLIASIQLGDATIPVATIYGLAFSFNYDPLVVDTAKTTITYSDSWFATNSEQININKFYRSAGQIKTAITRLNHANRSGFGEIGHVSMIITTDNINGKNFSYYNDLAFISGINAIDKDGNPVALNTGVDSAQVEFTPNGIETLSSFDLQVYPNPAYGKLFISSKDIAFQQLSLSNVIGEKVMEIKYANERKAFIDVSTLANGVYLLNLQTEKGSVIKRITINK